MSDYTTLTLVGRHVPDDASGPFDNMQQAQAAGHDVLNPVTGMYEIGALIDGAFVPLVIEKASLVFDAINLAKQQQAEQQSAQPQQPPAGQGDTTMQTGEPGQPGGAQPAAEPTPTDQPQG